MGSKLVELHSRYGQSIWLDYIERDLLVNGGLHSLVSEGLRGVTSNPTIFCKAITNSSDYDEAIRDLIQADPGIDAEALYRWLTVQDTRMAADLLRPVYDSSKGGDGFVSLEVSPHLAYDAEATIEAARHLGQAVNRPNLLIKVPATVEGLRAIECLVMEGINVNVTLLFSVERYKAVIEAYLRGVSLNDNPRQVVSVASFFVSRVDTKVDAALEELGGEQARQLKGRIAIANSKLAYQHFKEVSAGAACQAQLSRGARLQRPLWASTSTKNPDYSDVLYVQSLIGPNTINTVTPQTLDALEIHLEPAATLERDMAVAGRELAALARLGIDLDTITDELEKEGVRKFIDSHDQLLEALHDKRAQVTRDFVTD